MTASVMVLNADETPLHKVSLKHAVRLIVREKAEIHEDDGTFFGPYKRPRVIRLIRYIVTKWRYNGRTPNWSKSGVLRRDNHTCAYCLGKATTIDHVIPRSKGGSNDWDNCVAACLPCNNKKRDRTPAQAGMDLHITPHFPKWEELI